jgi:CMP-N-acetylneuraminic acid synthetase
MNLLITICGRGGSKGIPGKNIRTIGGKPLIAYSIETAKKFAEKHNGVLTLSTDSEEIKNVAAQFGLRTDYVRPAEMATDTAGKLPVLVDVLNWEEQQRNIRFDYLLDLDITSPLRTVEDLEIAFEILKNDENALNLFSVNPAHRNPYFNMVEQNESGYYSLVKKLPDGVVTRQAAPKVYDMNASFYFYKRSFFESGCRTAISPKSLIYVMPHLCFDLDEPVDFLFMEYLIENNKLGFEV